MAGPWDSPPTAAEQKAAGVWDTPPTPDEIGGSRVESTLKSIQGAAKSAAKETPGVVDRAVGKAKGIADTIGEAAQSLGIEPEKLTASLLMGPAGPAFYTTFLAGKAVAESPTAINTIKDIVKDDAAAGLAMAAMGPAAIAIGPMAYRPAGQLIRDSRAIASGKKSADESVIEGNIKGGVDTAVNVAGAGLGAATRVPGAIARRIAGDKVMGALTQFAKNVAERHGPAEALQAAGGRAMGRMKELAGDLPMEIDNFIAYADTIRKKAESLTGATAAEKEVLKIADRVAERVGGEGGAPAISLSEADDLLRDFGDMAKSVKKSDEVAARVFTLAKKSVAGDLSAATGNKELAELATGLAQGRATYAKGKRAEELLELVTKSADPLSTEGHMSPRKFAVLNSGKNWEAVKQRFKGDPEGLEAWKSVVDAARVVAKKGNGWLPEYIRSPRLAEAMQNLMTSRNAVKMFSDPETAAAFKKLIDPRGSVADTEGALALIAQLSERVALADGEGQEDEPKARPEPAPYFAGNRGTR